MNRIVKPEQLPTHTIEEIREHVKDTDFYLAKGYLELVTSAVKRNIPIDLTMSQYKAIKTRKVCALSGVRFSPDIRVTIDRVCSTLGYTKSNCVAVTRVANQMKGIAENNNNQFTIELAIKVFNAVDKLLKNKRSKATTQGKTQ